LSEIVPHWAPALAHVCLLHVSQTWVSASQTIGLAHVPQSIVVPHPLSTRPQLTPRSAHCSGVHAWHWFVFGLQVCPGWQVPQFSTAPQSFVMVPHVALNCAQVERGTTHVLLFGSHSKPAWQAPHWMIVPHADSTGPQSPEHAPALTTHGTSAGASLAAPSPLPAPS